MKNNIKEIVARAICIACGERSDAEGDARGNEKRWQDYIEVAEAAIMALAQDGILVRIKIPNGYENTPFAAFPKTIMKKMLTDYEMLL